MFESLLEQILQKFLGQFVQGLNSQNLKLGVWSGNVVIENVSIKPEVLEMFEIPIALKFSSIGKLSLQVPWSSLSSSPVEVVLEKVFIIIGPKQQKDWKFVDYNTIMKKIELIENYAKACIQKFLVKEKSLLDSSTKASEESQAGYFEKLKLRIIDNLQVTIKSIHIRFENQGVEGLHDELKYSWGITLDKLEIFTTDTTWKKNFFDRTDIKNKDKPMNKLLILGSFCLYWNPNEIDPIAGKPNKEVLDSLTGLIKKTGDLAQSTELLSINAEIKLVQKTKLDNFDSPEFILDIELKAINTNLKKLQLQEIIHLIDIFNVYHNKLMQKRKCASIISEQDKQRHSKDFIVLYEKIMRSATKDLTSLLEDEKQTFQDILMAEPLEALFPWVKEVVKNVQKEQKISQIELKKQKEAKGWFGGWWGGAGEKTEITKEEKGEWEKFFEDNFSEEALNMPSIIKPIDYVWFQLEFRLEGGSITLSNITPNGNEEGIKFQFEGMKAVLLQRGEKNLDFSLFIMEFNIDLLTVYKGSKNPIKTSFLSKNELVVNKNEAFLSLKFEKYPNKYPEKEIQPDSEITLVNKSSKIVYNPIAVKRLVDFFDVKFENDELKDAAWQQLEKLNDATKKNLSQVMKSQTIMKLNILLESPFIIIPFEANNDPSNECWMLNLGTLTVQTNDFLLSKTVAAEEKIFDIYDIQLKNFQMQHFPSVLSLMKAYSDSHNIILPENSFSLIPEFSISVSISLLKSVAEEFVKNKPSIIIKGTLPTISLNLAPQIYQKLLKITDSLIIAEGKETIEMLQTEKTSLMASAKKVEKLWRRHHASHIWEPYIGVLSGSYIYFYEKPKDLQAIKYQYIKNSVVTLNDNDTIVGMKNAFKIKNSYGSVYLACEKEENAKAWVNIINSCQDEVSLRKEAKKIAKQEEFQNENQTLLNADKLKILVDFEIENFSISLYDEEQKFRWFNYSSNGFRVNFKQYPFNIYLSISLHSLEITDPLRVYLDPTLNKFLYCSQKEEKQGDFMTLKLNYMDRKHPKYSKTDTDLDIELGSFLLNFKPDTLLSLLAFIKPKSSIPKPTKITSKESVELLPNLPPTVLLDDEIKVMNVRLFLHNVTLKMVHRRNYLSIAELQISETRIVFQQKLQEMYIELEIGNFQLIDLTNYPKTLYLESQNALANRRELLGLVKGNDIDSSSLMMIKFWSFQEGSPKIEKGINSIAKIEISSVKVDFVMQPIFRILDYVLVQIVGTLTTPEIFNEKQKEIKKNIDNKEEVKEEIKITESLINRILLKIEKTPNILLDITIIKPLICIKPNSEALDYLLIDLGVITIKNDRKQVKRPETPIFCDFYRIWMKDMGIRIIRDGNREFELSRPYHFNLEVEKPCFIDDYKQIYNENTLDLSLRIRSRILPIVLSLYKVDYLLIMKILFANISYDDMMDRFHIHDYQKNKEDQIKSEIEKNTKKNQLVLSENQNKPNILIHFLLDIDNITIFIMNPMNQHGEAQSPLARIAIDVLRVLFIKNSNNILNLEVYGNKLRGNYYENYKEYSLLGDFTLPKECRLGKTFTLSTIDSKFLKSNEKCEYTLDFTLPSLDLTDSTIKVFLIMKPDGTKIIDIGLNGVKTNTQAGILMLLSGFATMDNTVTPPEPQGKSLNLNEPESSIIPLQSLEPAKMSINIDIKNLLVLISSPNNVRPLAMRGNIGIELEMKGSRAIDELLKLAELERKKHNSKGNEPFNEYELNRVFHLDLKLEGIELFICHYDEIFSNFQQVRKRNILLPFDMQFIMSTYLAWTTNQLFFSKTKNKVTMSKKSVFRISYQDIANIQKISTYQLSTLAQFQPPEDPVVSIKKPEASKKLKNVLSKVQKQVKSQRDQDKLTTFFKKKVVPTEVKELKQDDILGNAKKKGDIMKLSDSDFNIITKGIELVIVNDAGDAFIPVFDVNIEESHIILKKNLIMMNLLTPFGITVSYYNPQVSRWEPIIEKAEFMIEFTTNAFQNPHLELKVYDFNNKQLAEEKKGNIDILDSEYTPFNINISTQMLSVLLKTLKLMSQETKVLHLGYKNEGLEEEEKEEEEVKGDEGTEELEYVSPFSIKNETGYTIEIIREVSCTKNKGKYQILNGETMNLQIESDRDQLFSNESQENFSKISVQIKETHHSYDIITGLDLSRVKTSRILLKETNALNNKESNDIYLVSDVGLDSKSNRRLITLSSQVLFQNRTQKTFYIKILFEKKYVLELVLPENSWVPIPLDLVKKEIMLRIEDYSNFSELCSLDKIINNKSHNSYPIEVGKFNFMFTVEKEGRGYGKTVVMIDPPYLIKNCLPVTLELQVFSSCLTVEKYLKMKPQEEYHEYEVPTSTKFFVNLKIAGFGWTAKQRLYSPNTDFLKDIKMEDGDGRSLVINVFHVESYVGAKKFFFYLKGYIINETTYKLDFHGIEKDFNDKRVKNLLAGQGKPLKEEERNLDLIMFSENHKSLEINEKDSEEWSSKEIPLGTIGDAAVEFQTKNGYVHLGVSIKLVCVDDITALYTKVVSFTPRYIFVNLLDLKMGIQQVGTDQCFIIVEKDREPYKWHDPKKPKKIYYTIITGSNAEDWNWSGEIDISAIGHINFLLRSRKSSALKFMKAEIRNDQGLIYIIIDEYKPGKEPYLIEHSLEANFEVSFYQPSNSQELKSLSFFIDNHKPLPFCWDYPNNKKIVRLTIKDQNNCYQTLIQDIGIDKIDSKSNYTLIPNDKSKYPEYDIQLLTIIENQSKKTSIKKYEKKKGNKSPANINLDVANKKTINREVEISCRLSHVGINIIQNTGGQSREIFYITIRNFEFCLVDTKKTRTLQTKIRFFNIDSNHTYLLNFPVLFTPTEYEKIAKKGKYFMNVYIEKSLKSEEVSNYKAVQIELEAFTIKIEDTLLSVLIQYYNALAEVLWPKNAEKLDPKEKRYLYQLDKNTRPKFWFWEIDEIPVTNQQTFIDEFLLSPIKLNLTFITKSKGADITSGFAVFAMFFKALGVALANIDDAPIKLTGLKLENCFDTTSGITSKLISHYKNNLTTEVFKLLGSINILGNPVGLFSSIGTGVQDLFEKPMEGFIKGPLEGGLGLAKGAGSLLSHTLAGTLNSLDKITGSLGTGIAALSLDDDYLAEREKMKMTKAKHVGQGLTQAGMSIFTGFEKGITGVFLKPIEGASKGGIKGFMKGTFQGLSGLILKPVSGILDAASKTAEGIKNTATTFDDKPKESRERLLRVFYGYDRYYMSFDKKDAELNYFLQVELKKGRFVGSTYFYGHLFGEEKNQMVLFVTLENFIYFDKKALKKKWIINTNNVKSIEMKEKEKAVQISLNFTTKKKQKLVELLVIQDENLRNFIYKKLKEVLDIKGSDQIQF